MVEVIVPLASQAASLPFDYREFLIWYEALSQRLLRPALVTLERLLCEKLDQELDEFARGRIRVASGRIKDPHRLWTKLMSQGRFDLVTDIGSIPSIIDDLVGVRIVCNNLCDIRRLHEVVGTLPTADESEFMPLAIEADSERFYFDKPKPSGYRAYHINLVTLVPGTQEMHPVRGELQVRTLLQNGWGELTHEDTYKPGTSLPPLAVTLARRMADLLATVDEMAEDLRQELDRATQDAMAGELLDGNPETRSETTDPEATSRSITGVSDDALKAELTRIVSGLSKPVPLAEVAQELQRILGPEVRQSWGGHGGFKSLLRAAIPNVVIVNQGPGYIVPEGVEESATSAIAPTDTAEDLSSVPEALLRLGQFDRWMPIVGPGKLADLIAGLNLALRADRWEALGLLGEGPGLPHLNALTKSVRDDLAASDIQIKRAQLDYLMKPLLFAHQLRPDLDTSIACEIVASYLYERTVRLGVSDSESDLDAIRAWLCDAALGNTSDASPPVTDVLANSE